MGNVAKYGIYNLGTQKLIGIFGQYKGGGGGETKFVMEVTIPSTAFVFRFDMITYNVANNMNIDWGDGSSDSGVTVDIDHTYATAGVYDIKVDGVGNFNPVGLSAAQKDVVTNIKNWGNGDFEFTSFYYGFYACNYITYTATDYPDLSNLATLGNAPKMDAAFRPSGLTGDITSIDFSNWVNTDKFTTHNYAFYSLQEATLLDLTGWDFSNSINFRSVFAYFGYSKLSSECVLKIPDITFNASLSSANIYSLFSAVKCDTFDVPVFDWSSVVSTVLNVSSMFYLALLTKLVDGKKTLDISTWIGTDKWQNVNSMFRKMVECQRLNITNIDWSNVTTYDYLFRDNYVLEEIVGLNEFTPAATSASVNENNYLFYNNSLLKFSGTKNNLDVNFGSTWNNNSNVQLIVMFGSVGVSYTADYTTAGDVPNLHNANTSTVITMSSMFSSAVFNSSLSPVMANWDFSSVTTLSNFMRTNKGNGTTRLDCTNWGITSALTTMDSAFRSSDLTGILFHSSSDFSGVTTWAYSFYISTIFTSLEFPTNVSFSSVTTMINFIHSASSMTTAQYDNFLLRFDATNSNSGISMTMGSSTYTGGGAVATARANIVARGNTISDGGIA